MKTFLLLLFLNNIICKLKPAQLCVTPHWASEHHYSVFSQYKYASRTSSQYLGLLSLKIRFVQKFRKMGLAVSTNTLRAKKNQEAKLIEKANTDTWFTRLLTTAHAGTLRKNPFCFSEWVLRALRGAARETKLSFSTVW